jgi:hypothetical protein
MNYKLLIISVISISLFFSCNNKSENNSEISTDLVTSGKFAEIKFDEYEHNFGDVIEGETVTHYFYFTNIGEVDLVISQANASCGCTVPEFTKDPVKPGGKGKLKVSFKSEGRSGSQSKSVNITSNSKEPFTELKIYSNVISK